MKYIPCAICFNNILPKKSVYLMNCGHCIHTRCKNKNRLFLCYDNPTICKFCNVENYGYKLIMTP